MITPVFLCFEFFEVFLAC